LLAKIGDIARLATVTPCIRNDGKSAGIKTYEVDNGSGLQFTVLESKCLDLFTAKFKGVKLNFESKAGLTAPQYYNPHGSEFLYQFQGGLLYTCGLSNTGPGNTESGIEYPIHGRIANQPASNVGASGTWNDGSYDIEIGGTVRQASLFGEDFKLTRKISTSYGVNRIRITDDIENIGYDRQVLMILYHFNFGYPLLDEGARFVMKGAFNTIPRDAEAKKGLDRYRTIEKPSPKANEHVFYHLDPDPKGSGGNNKVAAAIINDKIGLGVYIAFDRNQLPVLTQWKSMASGDYALGIEPGNSKVGGREKEMAANGVEYLEPAAVKHVEIEIGVLEGSEMIRTWTQDPIVLEGK
jgi:hypothetical protein